MGGYARLREILVERGIIPPSDAAPSVSHRRRRLRLILAPTRRSTSPRKFLLRRDDGYLFGVYERNAQAALSGALLELKLIIDTFRGFDLCETPEGTLFVRG